MDRLHSRRLAATHSTNPATRKGAAPSSYFKQQSMEEAGSGKGGRTYIHRKHKRRTLLQQPQEEAAATQEEVAATATTRGGRCYTRGGCSFSHSKYKEAAPTANTIRPQLQRKRSALAHKKGR